MQLRLKGMKFLGIKGEMEAEIQVSRSHMDNDFFGAPII